MNNYKDIHDNVQIIKYFFESLKKNIMKQKNLKIKKLRLI